MAFRFRSVPCQVGRFSGWIQSGNKFLSPRDHHLQLASKSNKLPTLFDSLVHLLGGLNVETNRAADFFASRENSLQHGFMLFRSRIGAIRRPHLSSQIDRAHEDRINAWQTVNRFSVLDAFRRLGLQDNQNLVIRLLVVVAGLGTKAERV